MYTILINEDNSLTTTNRERVMQRSKLFDKLWFLTKPQYKGYDMTLCTVLLEYLLPVSKKYCSEFLVLSEERYNDYLVYQLPLDTNLTAEAGQIEIMVTFIYSDLDESGHSIQRVRKIDKGCIDIIPISAWCDIIPDSALSALDQRIIKMDAQIKAIDELNSANAEAIDGKADDLSYDKSANTIQLLSGDTPVGTKVHLNTVAADPDGLPVVDIGGGEALPGEEGYSVVLF